MYNGSIAANAVTPSVNMKNRLINGQFTIDQRNSGASVTPNSSVYTLDRWELSIAVSSKLSVQQSSTAPAGFRNSVLLTSTSAYTPGASDYMSYCQKVEGFNFADMMWGTADAQTVTLSFWVRSSLTGTFSGALQNDGAGRSYPYTFTISAANTWEYKTVTIAGDTSGTWNTTNGKGVEVHFNVGSGSNLLGTAGAWASAWRTGATGSVSLISTNGATMNITGVQLEKGSTATSFDYRSFGAELLLCQRYCEALVAGGTNGMLWPIQAGSSTNARGGYSFKVQKRASASFTNLSGTSYLCQYTTGNFTPGAVNLAASNASGALIDSTCTGLTPGQAGFVLEGSLLNGAIICLFTAEL
jgi:hypothetical protein